MCDYEDEKLETGIKKVSLGRLEHVNQFSMSELNELEAWVAGHPDILGNKTVEEIAKLAIAAGFDRIVVTMWESSERFKRA